MNQLKSAYAGAIEADPFVKQVLLQVLHGKREVLPDPRQVHKFQIYDFDVLGRFYYLRWILGHKSALLSKEFVCEIGSTLGKKPQTIAHVQVTRQELGGGGAAVLRPLLSLLCFPRASADSSARKRQILGPQSGRQNTGTWGASKMKVLNETNQRFRYTRRCAGRQPQKQIARRPRRKKNGRTGAGRGGRIPGNDSLPLDRVEVSRSIPSRGG